MSWSNEHNEMVVTYANGKVERTRIDDPREMQLSVWRARTKVDVDDVDCQTVKTPKKKRR